MDSHWRAMTIPAMRFHPAFACSEASVIARPSIRLGQLVKADPKGDPTNVRPRAAPTCRHQAPKGGSNTAFTNEGGPEGPMTWIFVD